MSLAFLIIYTITMAAVLLSAISIMMACLIFILLQTVTADNKLYLNKGNFEFEDITEKAGVAGTSDWCTGVTMADVNGDGFLDIYVCAVANIHGFKGHNELFINNGNGTFTESAAKYGLDFSGTSTQAVFFDYDHDGDLDCYILNQSDHPNQNIVDTSNRENLILLPATDLSEMI